MKLSARFLPAPEQSSVFLLTIVVVLASCHGLPAQELSKLPYVPTPQVVVDEMLKLANVTAKDFVVDLGSGDGRMIITAARDFIVGTPVQASRARA